MDIFLSRADLSLSRAAKKQIYSCYIPEIDGQWSMWSAWATCSQTCGGGSLVRSRLCDNPSPQHSGADCQGPSYELQSCNTHCCKYLQISKKLSFTKFNCAQTKLQLKFSLLVLILSWIIRSAKDL